MCLAIPLKVIKINNLIGTVDLDGASKEVSLMLLPEEVGIGDYVLVHAGFAIQKVDEEAARDTLALLQQIAEFEDSRDQGASGVEDSRG
jgi:hydrogenase expression/formation protein HypC